ncbi:MAG: site-2 protease family protein [Candidatus Nanohaloarchaea archaeon]|nr:site-2 protease family protein [Candidatus Nanohaloarchaea archaeon]
MSLFSSPRFWFLVALVGVITFILWKDRDKIQRHSILFFRRTKKGVDKIKSIADSMPLFWNWYGWIGAVAGIISIPVITYQLASIVGKMVFQKASIGGPSIVLPGLVAENHFQAGVSFIPVEYWIIGIGIILVVHELSHGVVASNEGFELNSVGWIIVGIIPGAFVEPKGEQMLPGEDSTISDMDEDLEGIEGEDQKSGGMWNQGDWKSRLKVLSAGSWANYITAGIFLILATGLVGAITQPGPVVYVAEEGFPAHNAGMDNGSLYSVNGIRTNFVADIQNVSDFIEPGDNVTIWSSEGNFTVTATRKKGFDGGYIGLRFGETQRVKSGLKPYEAVLQWLVSLLFTISALNFGIGLFNMVPAKPLDGGHIVDTLLERFAQDKRKYMRHWSIFVWAVVISMILTSVL